MIRAGGTAGVPQPARHPSGVRGPFPCRWRTRSTWPRCPPRRSWSRPPRPPAAWPPWRAESFCSPASWTGARDGGPKVPPRSKPGSSNAVVSPCPPPEPGHTSPSGSSTFRTWRRGCPRVSSASTRSARWSTPQRPRRTASCVNRPRSVRSTSWRSSAGLSMAHRGPRQRPTTTARSVRFNDTFRTVTAQLPPETYAEVRSSLEARARQLPSDGETRWDQRVCDALLEAVRTPGRARSASPYVVVAHVPLAAVTDESSEVAGQLERGELISGETVRRIACDATIVIALDDDVGHTMYEGRARRFPTDAQRREIMRRDRHCRFPGCTNVTFTNAHHVAPWNTGGRTDLHNLALLCEHHHRRVHTRSWTMSGDANGELTFVGPTGRAMTSRPSPLWTAVSAPSAN